MDEDKVFMIGRGKIVGWRFDARVHSAAFDLVSKRFQTVPLKNIVEINPRTTFSGVRADTLLSFVPMESISDSHGVIAEIKHRPFSENIGYTNFQEGDLLWAKITPCMENGKSAVAQNLLNGFGFGSTEYHVLRPRITGLNIRYLHFLLRLSNVRKAATNYFGGSSGHQRVDAAFFSRLHIPLPDISVQNQIVAELDMQELLAKSKRDEAVSLLAGIDDYLLAELGINLPPEPENTLASRIFTAQWRELEQRLDPAYFSSRFSRIQHALEAMPHTRLREVALFSSEQWDQEGGFCDEFPYLEISAINTSTGEINNIDPIAIVDAPSRARMYIRQDDILVSTTRPNRGAITHIGSEITTPLIASTGFSVIRHVTESRISKEFLLILLRSHLCLMQFEQRSSGGNYPAITQVELGRVLLPSVELSVQNKIVARVKTLHAEAKRLRQQAETELEAAKRRIEALLLGAAA